MPDSNQGKLQRSWSLFTGSLQVIRQNPRLMLFPLTTSVCSVVMLLFFLAPALLYPSGHTLQEGAHWRGLAAFLGFDLAGAKSHLRPNGLFYAYLAAGYLVSMFMATFFNVAFYHEILQALAGNPVSIRTGLRFASRRLPSILAWSLFAGLVGLIIQALEEKLGWVGRWVMRFVGMVWSVASVFAIPVIIREDNPNPIGLLRNSALLLRKTWGESLIGYVGITAASWIVLVGSLVFLIGAALVAAMLKAPVLIVLAVAIWLFAMLVLGYLSSVAADVYRCALYVYASEGVVPAPYTAEMLDAAWKVKKS